MNEKVKKEIISWGKSIMIAAFVAIICRTFLFSPTTVHGESMSPTFHDMDKILLSKVSGIQRFDMVVFQAPDAKEQYIKRVIGLPGDKIEMKDDVLYINGEVLTEPYLDNLKERNGGHKLTGDFTLRELTGEEVVPTNHVFVLGDNRLVSHDSRYFGFITMDSIIGEVKFRFYPLQHVGLPE
ncbi:signal peptidase I [Bacillus sp. B1-b2]|uniref:signal peptidase I n=1 Tax=Bacillus sp. B1-b2 TaxID=2653201 RepID=UPI001261E373|nr:signal peptidase I [Bacillus sp. B1-b2]KAB7672235.1 signal peptidase I [Bacillus sp. B1-b2]